MENLKYNRQTDKILPNVVYLNIVLHVLMSCRNTRWLSLKLAWNSQQIRWSQGYIQQSMCMLGITVLNFLFQEGIFLLCDSREVCAAHITMYITKSAYQWRMQNCLICTEQKTTQHHKKKQLIHLSAGFSWGNNREIGQGFLTCPAPIL